MKRLSVIQVSSARDEWGGIEQHTKYLAQGLIERGHRVVFATRDYELAVKSFQEVGEVHTFPIRSSIDFQSIKGIARLIQKENTDIIHAHTSRDAWVALFATLAAGRGRVVTTRHIPLPAKQDVFHKLYYRQLAAIVCVSEYVRNIFLGERPAVDPGRVSVVYPGIDLTRFTSGKKGAIRGSLGLKADDVVVGYVGRITREKGLDDLIQAVAILNKKGINNLHAVLVGAVNPLTPDYADELRSAADKDGLSGRVHFCGFSKDIAAFMYDFDMLVLPSVIPETFGMVLCEGMACGKPVIATTTGAQVEIIRDGVTGLLVPPCSPERLAEALERLVGDREKADSMGQAGKADVTEKFSLVRTIQAIEKCYEMSMAD